MTTLAGFGRVISGAVRRLIFTWGGERLRVGILLKANVKENQAFTLGSDLRDPRL
jgi:hypothetical protein